MDFPYNLLISLGSIIIIVWLFLHYSKNYTQEKPKSRVLYICGYAVLIIVELVVYICIYNSQKENIIETVSFGATLSSLIMSIIAIIFTIVSGKNNNEQIGRINEATEKLGETAVSLKTFTVIADHIDDQLEAMFNHIRDLKSGQRTYLSRLDTTMKTPSVDESGSSNTQISSKVGSLEDFFACLSPLGTLTLYACSLAKKTDKTMQFEEFGRMFDQDNYEYIYGFLMACSCFKIIAISDNWPNFKVLRINPDIEAYAKKRYDEIQEESPKESYRKWTSECYDRINEFFIPTQTPDTAAK